MSQLSATGALCTRMHTAASELYVLLHIRSLDRGMPETISKDPGKEEPGQSKCSMDFSRHKGGWMEHQYSHSWRNKDRK
jgi:hypothetical protein